MKKDTPLARLVDQTPSILLYRSKTPTGQIYCDIAIDKSIEGIDLANPHLGIYYTEEVTPEFISSRLHEYRQLLATSTPDTTDPKISIHSYPSIKNVIYHLQQLLPPIHIAHCPTCKGITAITYDGYHRHFSVARHYHLIPEDSQPCTCPNTLPNIPTLQQLNDQLKDVCYGKLMLLLARLLATEDHASVADTLKPSTQLDLCQHFMSTLHPTGELADLQTTTLTPDEKIELESYVKSMTWTAAYHINKALDGEYRHL